MRVLERMVAASRRRPGRVLAVAFVLVVIGTALAVRLAPSAATSTLVGTGSREYRATETLRTRFGDNAIVVLVRGPLPNLVLTANLDRLIGLEGCLSGNTPQGATPAGGTRSPCGRLTAAKPVQVVYGPGTFINSAVGEINDQIQVQLRAKAAEAKQAATAAEKLAQAQGRSPAQV
jgi:hypothetical protein